MQHVCLINMSSIINIDARRSGPEAQKLAQNSRQHIWPEGHSGGVGAIYRTEWRRVGNLRVMMNWNDPEHNVMYTSQENAKWRTIRQILCMCTTYAHNTYANMCKKNIISAYIYIALEVCVCVNSTLFWKNGRQLMWLSDVDTIDVFRQQMSHTWGIPFIILRNDLLRMSENWRSCMKLIKIDTARYGKLKRARAGHPTATKKCLTNFTFYRILTHSDDSMVFVKNSP
jgi:hypothetical protein